ncbi:MAG: hypothetical protein J5726_10595 [Treponema sp.]|nr:hypothetical protein [Treponema sp.]
MAVLVTYAQYEPEQTIEISATKIHAEFERLNLKTIKKSLQHLTELHYIETIKQEAPKPNKYKVLIDVPKAQAQTMHQKKNPYKQSNEQGTMIEEYKRIVNEKPFLN